MAAVTVHERIDAGKLFLVRVLMTGNEQSATLPLIIE